MTKKFVYMMLGVLVVTALVSGFMVGPAHGQSDTQVGVVNLERVLTEYMAEPLLDARDELQDEFDKKSADLEDETEIAELFGEYQSQLNELENEYRTKIQDAITEVGEKQGLDVILPQSGVLYGGVDLTDEVLAVLQ